MREFRESTGVASGSGEVTEAVTTTELAEGVVSGRAFGHNEATEVRLAEGGLQYSEQRDT